MAFGLICCKENGDALSESYAMVNFSFKYFPIDELCLLSHPHLLGGYDNLTDI